MKSTLRHLGIAAIIAAIALFSLVSCEDTAGQLVTYTVTFNANGASGTAPSAQTANSGSSITIPNGSDLTKSGYTFGGWNTNADGRGTNYAAGYSYTVIGTVTLYAKWEAVTYTVTFNANGATGGTAPAAMTANAGSNITLPSGSSFTRSSYTFGGWNTNAYGWGTNYSAGFLYTVTGDVTLYARWEGTVTFNINGGSGTTPGAQTVNAGSSITLPSGSGFTRSGYTFGGWNTNESGTGTNYSAGSSYTPTSNITLYSRWIENYTVTFSANGATGGTAPAAMTANAGSSITLPSGSGFTRSGYTFGGWSTNESGTGTNYDAGASYTVTGNITLYARWITNYTVTFSINSGSGAVPAAQNVASGSRITLPGGSGFSRSGYIFGGWNTNESGTGTNYNAGASYTVTGTITLYARWITSLVVMVFVPGGSFQMGNPNSAVGGSHERPVHTVTLTTGFYMGKYEVTQAQYRTVMGTNPSSGYGVGDNYPVYSVSWYDAVNFCNQLSVREGLTPAYTVNGTSVTWNRSANGYRLPTEAEWEYAAKGGNGSPGNYTYAGSDNADSVAWYDGNSGSTTHTVGTKSPNGLGIYDMSGNVWEWCWDWYGYYSSGAQTDPMGASSGSNRVRRGGVWVGSVVAVRSAARYSYDPNGQGDGRGFRLARNGN